MNAIHPNISWEGPSLNYAAQDIRVRVAPGLAAAGRPRGGEGDDTSWLSRESRQQRALAPHLDPFSRGTERRQVSADREALYARTHFSNPSGAQRMVTKVSTGI